jgi:hypothetical protein
MSVDLERLADRMTVLGLRPVIDPVLDIVLCDCPSCKAQDRDELGLWRPVHVVPRNGRTTLLCTACGREEALDGR